MKTMPTTPNKACWRQVPVGELCQLQNGSAFKPQDWSTSGVPIIRIQNLNDGTKPFNYWAGPLDDKVPVKSGDVLLAWSGTPGTSFGVHVWGRGPGVLNQHIFRVDFSTSAIIPEWFLYAVNHQLDFLISKAHGGVGLRHVRKAEVEALRIPLPSVEEQRRIVAKLNEQMAAVERARAAAEEQAATAKSIPRVLFLQAFARSAARAWKSRPLSDLCDFRPARSLASDGDAEVCAVTTACLSEIGFNHAGVKTARMWQSDVKICRVEPGEVLIARSNTPELVGRVAAYKGGSNDVVATDLTIRIWPRDALASDFLAGYLTSLYLSGYWKERAGGASGSMKKITRTQLLVVPCPVPPLVEQRKLVKYVLFVLRATKSLNHAVTDQLQVLDRLPESILSASVLGRS